MFKKICFFFCLVHQKYWNVHGLLSYVVFCVNIVFAINVIDENKTIEEILFQKFVNTQCFSPRIGIYYKYTHKHTHIYIHFYPYIVEKALISGNFFLNDDFDELTRFEIS